MSVLGIIYALVTVLAWGTWLAPSQNVPMKGQQTRTFYVTLAVMLLALIASIFVGFEGLNASTFWFPFLGGLIWALSGWSAFVGTNRLGMAKAFGIRIEMRQIGYRQEAQRLGGIGSCGRELCCSTFVTNFVSVSTNTARVQEVALNPQKLAGQCGKLKCCLNYELAGYEDARKHFPDTGTPLKTAQGEAHHLKTDVYRNIMWFGYQGSGAQALVPVPVERVAEIRELNKRGVEPDELNETSVASRPERLEYTDGAGKGSLTRFEKGHPKKKKKRKPPRSRHQRNS